MTIPASDIVNVLPGVVSAGGSPLALNGVMLTENVQMPANAVLPFVSPTAVANYFGPNSTEARLAAVYFAGYDNSTIKPSVLYFAGYVAAPVAAYLRTAPVPWTLSQLQTFAGALSITVDGTPVNSSGSISLSAATSFTNAATIIQTAMTGVAVTWNAQLKAFQFASLTTGASSTVGYLTGSALAVDIFGTQGQGAIISPGAIAGVPTTYMATVTAITQNWGTFMTVWEPNLTDKLGFAQWSSLQNNRWLYVEWDTDATAAQPSTTSSFGYIAQTGGDSGSMATWNTPDFAAFMCGGIASINFQATNGRATMAFRGQAGFTPTVTDEQTAANLRANNYNYYGSYATANQLFNFTYPGSVLGEFQWADSFVNQIYMNAQFQLALMELLTSVGSVPYNNVGSSLIDAALQDPINAAVNFGGIRSGVRLSALQAAEVNLAAGIPIDSILSTRGWYLQVLAAQTPAQQRGLRKTPPCSFWYTDGGSVQQITLASVDVL